MTPGGDDGTRKGGGEDDDVAALGGVVGDELAETDLPRSAMYPTRVELVGLDRRVDATVTAGWKAWLDQIFSLARDLAPTGGLPQVARDRATLLAELEALRRGTTTAEGLARYIADDARLAELVQALALIDSATHE